MIGISRATPRRSGAVLDVEPEDIGVGEPMRPVGPPTRSVG